MRLVETKEGSLRKVTYPNGETFYVVQDWDYLNLKTKLLTRNQVISFINHNIITNACLNGGRIQRRNTNIKIERVNEKNVEKVKNFLQMLILLLVPEQSASSEDEFYAYEEIDIYKRNIAAIEDDLEDYCKHTYVCFEGNGISGLFTVRNGFDVNIVNTIYIKSWKAQFCLKVYSVLSENIKNSYFDFEYLPFEIKDSDFKFLNYNSLRYPDYQYSIPYHCLITKYDVNAISKKIDDTFLPETFNKSEVVYKHMTLKDLEKYIEDSLNIFPNTYFYPYWRGQYGMHSVIGFSLFSTDEVRGKRIYSQEYIVAMYKGKIIGIISYSQYNETDKYQAFDYIDVNKAFWRNGIATNLIKCLNRYLNPNLDLYLTMETRKGKEVGITEVVKKHIKNKRFLTREK